MSRSLADVARGIKDSEQFTAAVQRVADAYRFLYRWDRARDMAGARAALRRFDKTAQELYDWLCSALGPDETPERQAARKLQTAAGEGLVRGREQMERAQSALFELLAVRPQAAEFLADDKAPQSAPRMAASTLWELLPHHGITVTVYDNGPAARLLVAIAREAGDRHLSRAAARKYLGLMRPTTTRAASDAKRRRKRT